MLAAQLCFTYLPVMNRLFHSAPIALWWWGLMMLLGGAVFLAAEAKKLAVRRAG